jgi:hypothetical protein
VSNPWLDYQENFRANLPNGVTYDENIARYFYNGKRFVSPWEVVRYRNYLLKLGFVEEIITATVAPTAYFYTDGDRIDTHPDYATLDSTGNYASTEGTIASVEWLVDGVDQAGSYVLSAGEAVVLRVTDSESNTRNWTIDASVAGIGIGTMAIGSTFEVA